MTSKKKQVISAFDGFKVLGLPYKQGEDKRRFSMYFFLPDAKDSLPALVEKMGSESRFLDHHLPHQKVEIGDFRIPRFKISFGFATSKVQKELGVVLPFSDGDGLTEMVDSRVASNLYVSSIFHKSFIEVNEEGTEAAAASAAVILGASLNFDKIDFVADQRRHDWNCDVRWACSQSSCRLINVREILTIRLTFCKGAWDGKFDSLETKE
ncbi:hypothetical protein LWI28_007156 [Acer negundo]|uniref:Serpin domain-containing protein n=1 Tax=Acer negundo TaxID=4023 RepID=A0AAD5P4P9_ACENE|nr:hypothetical protein LWI28_007156 [Acer negundo]